MHELSMRGPRAVIQWGYREAAVLGPWTLVGRAEGGGTLTADVDTSDAFRVTQAPLTFVHPNGTWSWPVLSLQITGSTLTAVLGP